MDFASLDLPAFSSKGADCHLQHPMTGELVYAKDGSPITIRMLGQDSPEFRAAVSSGAERNAKTRPGNVDAAEANSIELLAALVVSWKGIDWNEKPLECTPDNVRMFLKSFPPIRAQLDAFVANRANFFKTGATK